jgi:heme-degrading monooxygenase HmoA
MITEIAQINVKPGMENDFEAGVKSAVPLFKRAKGCKGVTLHRSHEKPARSQRVASRAPDAAQHAAKRNAATLIRGPASFS